MLWKGNKKFTALWVGSKPVAKMWRGAVKIFDKAAAALVSCFGSGVWLSQKPWIGTDKWKSSGTTQKPPNTDADIQTPMLQEDGSEAVWENGEDILLEQ